MRLALLLSIAIAVTACASTATRLTYGELESSALRKPMKYAVYAPPGWKKAESLPLVVFLHGGGDGPDCFDRAGVGQHRFPHGEITQRGSPAAKRASLVIVSGTGSGVFPQP